MITIDYNDIFDRCRRETAYIARKNTDNEKNFATQFDKQFHLVRIRGSDKTLIETFIREAAHILEASIGWALQGRGQYTLSTVEWQFKQNVIADNDSKQVEGLIDDILTNYTLYRWLNTNNENAALAYESLWRQATKNMNNTLCNFSAPTKKAPYNYENTNHTDTQ